MKHANGTYLPIVNEWGIRSSLKRKILQEKFFVKWKDEYLSFLSKNKGATRSAKDIKVGSIVLLINVRKNRHDWPLARVERVFTSNNNTIRSVELRLPMSAKEEKTKESHLRRTLCISSTSGSFQSFFHASN